MQWHPKNEREWPEFEKFLRDHVPAAVGKDPVGRPFRETALRQLATGKVQPKVAVAAATQLAIMWNTPPPIWVDVLNNAAAIFSKTEKVIVVNVRLIRTFERSPARQEFRDALEMLTLHELLHWLIDHLGGTSEHAPRDAPGRRDPVYDFEAAAYPNPAALDLTLDRMIAEA